MHAVIGFEGGLQGTLSCGLLTPQTQPRLGPWLHKRVVAVGSDGIAEGHVASHFRKLTGRAAGWVVKPSTIDSYRDAQRQFYATLRDGILRGEPWPRAAEDQRGSLEILVACQQSERLAAPVTLPLQRTAIAERPGVPMQAWASSAPPRPGVRVSIVMPTRDHRDVSVEAVASWTQKQRCRSDLFELILITDEHTAHLEEHWRRLLRPQDRIIQRVGNDMVQYDARRARSARRHPLFHRAALSGRTGSRRSDRRVHGHTRRGWLVCAHAAMDSRPNGCCGVAHVRQGMAGVVEA